MEELVEVLLKNNYSISSIESFTAGMFASELCNISGISKCFKGSLVCYDTSIKTDVLNIDNEIISKYGVISIETANEMAILGSQMFGSDICVSFTGNAGPNVMDDKPVGYICMSVYFRGQIYSYQKTINSNRNNVRKSAIEEMFLILLNLLK